jgi:hypothetical protein
MTIEEEAAQPTNDIPLLEPDGLAAERTFTRRIQMRTTLKDGTVMDCPGALCFTPRPGALEERAQSSDELRAAMARAIERATAARSSPAAIDQAMAAIRADAQERVYDGNDLRALWRLALLKGGH